jgi:hypothetical protein
LNHFKTGTGQGNNVTELNCVSIGTKAAVLPIQACSAEVR